MNDDRNPALASLCRCAEPIFNPGNEFWGVAFHQLLETGAKLVEEVHAGVVANRGTKIVERLRR